MALLLLSIAMLAASAPPAGRSAVPTSHQLEHLHRSGGRGEAAHQAVKDAVPVGTPVAHAVQGFTAAGARCKAGRGGATDCVLHHFDLSEGFADNVRWSVRLEDDAGAISNVTVDRELVRHGA